MVLKYFLSEVAVFYFSDNEPVALRQDDGLLALWEQEHNLDYSIVFDPDVSCRVYIGGSQQRECK